MSFDDSTSEWTVSCTNTRNNETSVLTISSSKIGSEYVFDYAMLVNETIKPDDDCSDLPADPNGLTFTNVSVDGKAIEWTLRENLKDCGEKVTVEADNSVVMTWTYK